MVNINTSYFLKFYVSFSILCFMFSMNYCLVLNKLKLCSSNLYKGN